MRIVWAEIRKELTLLIRDKAGLALLFLMPALLVVVMTYIQDAAFRVLSNEKVELVWVDLDQSTVSKSIATSLQESGYFTLVDSINNQALNKYRSEEIISDGKYQVGLIIPKDFEKHFKARIRSRVDSLLQNFGLGDSQKVESITPSIDVTLLFDPLTKATYKTSVSNGVQGLVNELETQYSFHAFQSKLAAHFPYNPGNGMQQKLNEAYVM